METFAVKQIPRSANRKADALSKLASAAFDHLSKEVLVEVLKERSIDGQEIAPVSTTAATWMTPLIDYLTQGLLQTDDAEARKVKMKAPQYAIQNDTLYRRGHLEPWLKCITAEEGKALLEEIHAGEAGAHEGAMALTGKTLRAGVYWPESHSDVKEVTKKCVACQTFSPLHHLPAAPMTSISSPWPFYQWGIDIVGPFPEAPGRVKFLIVAVDYFTKWIEAEAVASITGRNMIKFMWKNILTRFGTPKVLVSDNVLQFAEDPFRTWCAERLIKQKFTSVAHPQANGQTEVSNRTLMMGLKKRLGKAKGCWVEELPTVLWSYRTTPRTSIKKTPFKLTYGTEAVLPPEIFVGSLRTTEFTEEKNNQDHRLNLDILEEKRELANIRQACYKAATEKYYNKRVKEKRFGIGDLVLRKNEASHAEPRGKLGPTWEGPYIITEASPKGCYILETLEGRAIPRTWNIQNLKQFHY
ncbi:hypothetical protein L2E82_49639 [Cichorium intybus]|uniref:Uncharacterized protein n=1 Tax=Cichorium intybus TaxID=13427 RepID=A0ACB8Z180_CICIN|nr:hypothetical protein L2E82_49639 [Cichorium intybus]